MAEHLHPFLKTIKKQINGGTVLLFTTLVALAIANSPFKQLYFNFFEQTHITINFSFWNLDKNLLHWINDGFMAIFFLLVGLEIKRELLLGELSSVKKAMVPIIAAVGGMAAPALLYMLLNFSSIDLTNGWAIPMATDIAFALGIIALLGKKVPLEIKILLTSLAIVDDLGAIVTIAIFYTDTILWFYLVIALVAWASLFALNRAGVRVYWVYFLIGILFIWYPMLKSGVHATVAGVLLAFTIPVDRKYDAHKFVELTKESLQEFIGHSRQGISRILTPEQYASVEEIRMYCDNIASPLQRMEHLLHSFAIYVVMPIFAFANTGVDFSLVDFSQISSSTLVIGIVIGLVFGKMAGILGFLWIFAKLGIISRPNNTTRHQLIGMGFLAGIGFTMSIFISDLAFPGSALALQAKTAVFIASVISGIAGYVILNKSKELSEWTDTAFWNLK